MVEKGCQVTPAITYCPEDCEAFDEERIMVSAFLSSPERDIETHEPDDRRSEQAELSRCSWDSLGSVPLSLSSATDSHYTLPDVHTDEGWVDEIWDWLRFMEEDFD